MYAGSGEKLLKNLHVLLTPREAYTLHSHALDRSFIMMDNFQLLYLINRNNGVLMESMYQYKLFQFLQVPDDFLINATSTEALSLHYIDQVCEWTTQQKEPNK